MEKYDNRTQRIRQKIQDVKHVDSSVFRKNTGGYKVLRELLKIQMKLLYSLMKTFTTKDLNRVKICSA